MRELESSVLGNREHWESIYDQEIINYNNLGDEGEVWFGEIVASKMLKYIGDNIKSKDTRILDLGCGNGHLIFALWDQGFKNIVGVDYSISCIKLCKAICENRGIQLNFRVNDIQSHSSIQELGQYELLIDKGTFDAISLSDQMYGSLSSAGRYVDSIEQLLQSGGTFVITSCNWTEEELLQRFAALKFVSRIKNPSFLFGGNIGSTVTTLIFNKS